MWVWHLLEEFSSVMSNNSAVHRSTSTSSLMVLSCYRTHFHQVSHRDCLNWWCDWIIYPQWVVNFGHCFHLTPPKGCECCGLRGCIQHRPRVSSKWLSPFSSGFVIGVVVTTTFSSGIVTTGFARPRQPLELLLSVEVDTKRSQLSHTNCEYSHQVWFKCRCCCLHSKSLSDSSLKLKCKIHQNRLNYMTKEWKLSTKVQI